jgi:hypothetical protein
MLNLFKSGTTISSGTIRKNNFIIAVDDTIGYGPTSSTGFWAGITPPSGGYTIYNNKADNGPSIFTSTNDNGVITAAKALGGTNINTIYDALSWFNGQSDRMVTNIDYPSIVTSGMTLNLDAGYVPSYPRTGTTWNDLSGNNNNGTLISAPTFNSASDGGITFSATNQYTSTNITVPSPSTRATTYEIAFIPAVGSITNLSGLMGWSGYLIDGFSLGFDNFNTIISQGYSSGSTTSFYNGVGNFSYSSATVVTAVYENLKNTYYINGVLAYSTTYTIPVTTSFTTINVGGYSQGGWTQSRCTVFYARVYDRALSASEVLNNYNVNKSRFGLP